LSFYTDNISINIDKIGFWDGLSPFMEGGFFYIVKNLFQKYRT